MTDLLDIPPFLRPGSPEHEEAVAKGRTVLEAGPPAPRRQASLKLAPVGQASRAKDENARIRRQLRDLGYSKKFSETVPITKAKAILAGIERGEGAPREDQI